MKYVWEVTMQNPHNEHNLESIYGVAANANIAISKAKKQLKIDHGIKSSIDDVTVVRVQRLHEVRF